MKDKCFELLKEQLLWQVRGGFEIYEKSIDLTIQIYCELAEIDEAEFRKKLNNIGHIVWNGYSGDNEDWDYRIETYKMLIDGLKK